MNLSIFARPTLACLMLLGCVALAGCSTATTIENETISPGVTQIRFKKVMVLALTPNREVRRKAEDILKSQITRVEAITSYSVIDQESDLKDLAKVRAAIKASGADGVIVLRPTSNHKEETVTAGKTYTTTIVSVSSFGGYYMDGYATQAFYQEPDRSVSYRVILIDAKIFDTHSEKLLWTARVVSTDPNHLGQLVKDTATAIREVLVRDNLIPAR